MITVLGSLNCCVSRQENECDELLATGHFIPVASGPPAEGLFPAFGGASKMGKYIYSCALNSNI